jgi:hypothetical protein
MAKGKITVADCRRAMEARDPQLPELVCALSNQSADTEGPIPEGAFTYEEFLRTLNSWSFRWKSDEEKAEYRMESWKKLEAPDAPVALPERLRAHEVIYALWEENGPFERTSLKKIIRDVELRWGPWRAIKKIFKEAEERGDWEIYAALAARFDAAFSSGNRPSGYYYYSTNDYVSSGTLGYLARRAWRQLRRRGETMPSVYADAAAGVLAFYEDDTYWRNTWVANHIFYHHAKPYYGDKIYGLSNFRYWSTPDSITEHRAYREAWERTPRPLFSLLERAKSEKVATFAIEALKADFRTKLREVESSWVARLINVDSSTVHDFVVWLLDDVPKFEKGSFRRLGLHEPVLALLDSPSGTARKYAADYARTHARDLPLEDLIRLANNDNNAVRELARDLLRERDPRDEVGLEAWGNLLGTPYGHDLAIEALREHFGAAELTADWFRERLLHEVDKVSKFARENLLVVHELETLGVDYFTGLFDEERLGSKTANFALDSLEKLGLERLEAEFLRGAVLHPESRGRLQAWIREDRIEAEELGVEYWKSLAYHPAWAVDTWIGELKESGRAWAQDLEFERGLAGFAREILGDVRRFSPLEVGFDWLFQLVERLEPQYHDFAVDYMLKAFIPADFAESGPQVREETEAGEVDLEGQSFVFTGTMSSVKRSEAQSKVREANGVNEDDVDETVDFLVVGDENSPLYGYGKKSTKHERAERLQERADAGLRIISETQFLQMLEEGLPEIDEEATREGCERLWKMATGEGEADEPIRDFAIEYIRHHHPVLGRELTEQPVDPGAAIPQSFLTYERVEPLFRDDRDKLRRLGLELARQDFARWAPPLGDLVELCELPYRDVEQFLTDALLADEGPDTERYRLRREHLDPDGVYRFVDSQNRAARQIGMSLIRKYPDLAEPEELFRLTESPDRQVRAFVIRTIWRLYRDHGITLHWQPDPLDTRFEESKRGGKKVTYERGSGPPSRPENWPAPEARLKDFLRRILFEIPPTKLSREEREMAGQSGQISRPIPARDAKLSLVEVMRDLAVEERDFAELIMPLLREFMESRGRSEHEACLVAVTRIGHTYESLDIWGEESAVS